MKEFNYYLKSLIGLLLLSSITGIFIGTIFESSTYAVFTAIAIMSLGIINLVSQLFHLHNPQNP